MPAKRTFIITLGYHEDYILRRIHENHATPNDTIIILAPQNPQPLTQTAIENLKAYTKKLQLPPPQITKINTEDTALALTQLTQTIAKQTPPIIIDLTGGPKTLAILTLLATIITRKPATIHIQPTPENPAPTHIPQEIIELTHNPLTHEKQRILQTIIENPGITIQELAQQHQKTPKTIKNYTTLLKRYHLVIQKGRKAALYPTKWAKIATQIKQ